MRERIITFVKMILPKTVVQGTFKKLDPVMLFYDTLVQDKLPISFSCF